MTREHSRRAVLGGSGTATVGALAGCVSISGDVTEAIDRTYDAETLAVRTRVGELTIETADRAGVLVEGQKQANDDDQLDELTLAADQDGDSLSLTVEGVGNGSGLLFGATPRIDLDITVPSSVSVTRLETNTGDVNAATGDTETIVETDTGEVRISDGIADVRTNTGDVETRESATPVAVSTDTGDVSIQDGRALRRVETNTGDVDVAVPALDGDVTVDTDTGDVELAIDSELDVTADAESSTGDIGVDDIGFEVDAQRSGRFEGTLGDGTHRVTVRSSTGDVDIEPLN